MSVFKRPDGYWRIQVTYTTPNGEKRRHSESAKTRREAIKRETEILAKLKGLPDQDILFSELTDSFIKSCKETRKLSTVNHYEKVARSHLTPFFGKMKFSKITTPMIINWKTQLNENPNHYSLEYKRHCYKVLKLIFKYAEINMNLINLSIKRVVNFERDPNEIIEDKKLNYWLPEEFKKWDDAIASKIQELDKQSKEYMLYQATRVLVNIAYFAGLRKGEINALLVSDFIDGDHPYLRINKSVTQQLGIQKYLVTSPKTKTSVRNVPTTKALAELLRNHIKDNLIQLKNQGIKDPYLTFGVAPLANTTAANIKNKIEEKCGIRHIKIHDLRHSFASNLINSGVPINIIAKLCGHSSPEITFRIYSHLFPNTGEEVIQKLEKYYQGKTEESK